MSNTPAPESAPEAGSQTPPTPALSSPSVGQQPSGQTGQTQIDPRVLAQQLLSDPTFKTELQRQLQADKDRRINKTEKRLGEIEESFRRAQGYLNQSGGDVEKAVQKAVVDEVYEQLPSLLSRQDNGQGGLTPFQASIRGRLGKLGLAENDPDVIALASKSYNSEADYLDELSVLAVNRAKGQAPAPNGAIVGTGGQAITTPDREIQRDQLTVKLAELQKHPSKNWQEINEVSAKLAKLVKPS